MEKKHTFYINLGTREISQVHEGNNDVFTIEATMEEMFRLRQVLDEAYNADGRAFLRAHIPYKHYSEDPENDDYDNSLRMAYRMLYDLGDEDTKAFIHSIRMDEEADSSEINGEQDPFQ
ncbi:hydrolase [Pontibacillus halophilus JSM 076056 = DSM 19796]|uniref:Hydrolase n=1 Tax=Pontibacillus halophilus JSM 076056 = DSM 19796 TaxID=1385510 RepID=A0A0A5GEH7_9BACI|nr:hypothetical protein [Pontibacillus halophilus]KGX89510.1 hydrolase [Pontibacillus halophilus JSM 076056 = DSM 19796]